MSDRNSSIEAALEQVEPGRRDFLRKMLQGTAAVAALPLLSSTSLAADDESCRGKGKGGDSGKGKGKGGGSGKGKGKGGGKGKGEGGDRGKGKGKGKGKGEE